MNNLRKINTLKGSLRKKSFMNNKGQISASYADVFLFIIISFVAVVFFGILYFGFGQVETVLKSVEMDFSGSSGFSNFTDVVDATYGQVYDAYGFLRIITYVIMFSMVLVILISNYLVRINPVFFLLYIMVCMVAIVVSAYVSNTYEGLLLDPTFGSTLMSFEGSSYVMLYLPYWVTVITLVGGLIMFMGIIRTRNQEGGLLRFE